jgi:hypothetical protein
MTKAVQTIVSIGDMRPREVLPIVGSAVVSGTLKSGTEASSSLTSDIRLSQEQRIKLAEALMFIVRRRAAADEFAVLLVNLMMFGSVDRIGSQTENTDAEQQRFIQDKTHDYFLRLDHRPEELEQESQEGKWEEQDTRVKTGGPVFSMEETDIVRSARVSVLAELVTVSKPSTVAPHCRLFVRLIIDVLRLDSSRTVCRAAALLARECYGCLLREQNELAEAVDDPNHHGGAPLPLAVALLSSDEELLFSTLRNHALSRGDDSERRVDDPATAVRCQEAISLREQADEAGIFTAARLVLSQSAPSPLPSILSGFRQNNSGIIQIDKMNSLG